MLETALPAMRMPRKTVFAEAVASVVKVEAMPVSVTCTIELPLDALIEVVAVSVVTPALTTPVNPRQPVEAAGVSV